MLSPKACTTSVVWAFFIGCKELFCTSVSLSNQNRLIELCHILCRPAGATVSS